MPVVDHIAGPGIGPNDIDLALPNCVRLETPADEEAFRSFMATVVRQTQRHASDTLRGMLADTPNAAKLADEFSQRLGL